MATVRNLRVLPPPDFRLIGPDDWLAIRNHASAPHGGYLVTPTLIRKIVKPMPDGSQQIVLDHTLIENKKSFKRIMKPETASAIATAIKFSTKQGGTASRANIFGYTEGGKTGTADKVINGIYSPQHVCSSFVGVVPAKNPAFVLIVTMDEPP